MKKFVYVDLENSHDHGWGETDSEPKPPVVATMSAKVITYATVGLTTTTIIVSYILAVALGHEKAWLPMISDCAIHAPEKYIFRYGMLVSAALLATNVLIIHSSTKSSYSGAKATLTSGLAAAFGLGLLTAVNVQEFTPVHGTAAVVFFLCYEIFMMIISANAAADERISRSSLNVKRAAALVSFVALISIAGMSFKWSHFRTPIAICEWTSTLMIQIFNLSFAKDLGSTALQEIAGIVQFPSQRRYKLQDLM